MSAYALINLGLGSRFRKHKGYKNTSKNERKTFLFLDFFEVLVTENCNSAFNKGFYLRQAFNYLLQLFVNSYVQKWVFVKDFYEYFNIGFVILKFFISSFAVWFYFSFLFLVLTTLYVRVPLMFVVNALFIFGTV